MGNTKLVDITGLSRYHENLKTVFNTKQDVIDDLDAIRSGAAAGAGALAEAKDYADSLAPNYDVAGAATGAAAQALADAKTYVDGKVDGKFDEAGAAAQALADAQAYVDGKVDGKFDEAGAAAGAAAQALADAKFYTDGKVDGKFDEVGAAAQALADAQAYVDGKVDGKFDEAGAAAEALEAAQAYVDGKVDGKFDAAGTAAGLNDAMDERVKVLEAIDHNKIATDAAAAAVAGVIDDAPESFDTLKEVAAWIANNDHATDVATLMTDVENLKKIDHDAYKGADETVLASAKSYADGLAGNYDSTGAAAQALADAKTYVDGKVDGKFDEAGAAAQALADAKADAASLYQVKGNYEAAGAAAQALADAQSYVDGKGYLTADDLVFAEDADIDALFA